ERSFRVILLLGERGFRVFHRKKGPHPPRRFLQRRLYDLTLLVRKRLGAFPCCLSGTPERIDVLELYIDELVDIDLGQAEAGSKSFLFLLMFPRLRQICGVLSAPATQR